jgi:hypothetical protein
MHRRVTLNSLAAECAEIEKPCNGPKLKVFRDEGNTAVDGGPGRPDAFVKQLPKMKPKPFLPKLVHLFFRWEKYTRNFGFFCT